ncbi:RHS repeat-associated core domain-containing protein, partial [Xanthocytophaga agilis]
PQATTTGNNHRQQPQATTTGNNHRQQPQATTTGNNHRQQPQATTTGNNLTGQTEGNVTWPSLQVGLAMTPRNNTANQVPKAYLRSEQIVQQSGYVRVFVVSESNVNTWFDELAITHVESPIVQENHYDPWGLNLVGIEVENNPNDKFQYNGEEKQEELGLNWMDYGFRNYDAQLGRWHAVDPVSDWAESLTPYCYGLNNPVNNIDLLGLWETTDGGYTTNKKEDIERFMTYLQSESIGSNNETSPSTEQMEQFVENEMVNKATQLINGQMFLSTVNVQGYRDGRGTRWYTDRPSLDNAWHQVQGTLTPDALDPRMVGQNLLVLVIRAAIILKHIVEKMIFHMFQMTYVNPATGEQVTNKPDTK